MAKFRSLSEAIAKQIERLELNTFPPSSPESLMLGQSKISDEGKGNPDDVLRWGSSIWGVATVSSFNFPGQKASSDDSGGSLN